MGKKTELAEAQFGLKEIDVESRLGRFLNTNFQNDTDRPLLILNVRTCETQIQFYVKITKHKALLIRDEYSEAVLSTHADPNSWPMFHWNLDRFSFPCYHFFQK